MVRPNTGSSELPKSVVLRGNAGRDEISPERVSRH